VLFDFDDSRLSPVVFAEGLISHQYQERKAEVERHREAVEYLRDAALSPRDSLPRIAEMRKAYAGGK
jgi:hypothetical protein